MDKHREQKPPKELVEDCFKISAGSLCKNILGRLNLGKAFEGMIDEFAGKVGEKILRKNGVALKLHFSVDLETRMLLLQYWLPRDYRMQEFYLDAVSTPFGERVYLTCDCGRRGELYLRPADYLRWGCRECLNLGYEVKRYNKRSAGGLLAYSLNRGIKLAAKEAAVKRIDYAGRLTRKARSLMRSVKKWALNPGLAGTTKEGQNV